jgi:threonyl-tRNA synthetase
LHSAYAQKIQAILTSENIRVEHDFREEKLGYKIREAQTKKIPYQLVIGDQEVENDVLTYRRYGEKEQYQVKTDDFVKMIQEEIKNK